MTSIFLTLKRKSIGYRQPSLQISTATWSDLDFCSPRTDLLHKSVIYEAVRGKLHFDANQNEAATSLGHRRSAHNAN